MKPSYRKAGGILLRVLAASLGGYAMASLAAIAFASLMPWCCGWSRAEGVLAGSLLSFVFYLATAIWVFSVRVSMVAAMLVLVVLLSALFPWNG